MAGVVMMASYSTGANRPRAACRRWCYTFDPPVINAMRRSSRMSRDKARSGRSSGVGELLECRDKGSPWPHRRPRRQLCPFDPTKSWRLSAWTSLLLRRRGTLRKSEHVVVDVTRPVPAYCCRRECESLFASSDLVLANSHGLRHGAGCWRCPRRTARPHRKVSP